MAVGQFIGLCHRCRSNIWLPQALYDAAKHSSKISFFCPYGHEAIFSERESEAEILRRERDQLRQQLAERDDMIRVEMDARNKARREVKALKASATKARQRTAAGLCPCCHRSFRQMALHMKQKHPEFKAEAVA